MWASRGFLRGAGGFACHEALLIGYQRADYRPVLPTISIPTLLLYGTDD